MVIISIDNDSWKNNWHVAELRNNAANPEMTSDFIDNYVLGTERGFISPNGINTVQQIHPNGIFRASSISWRLGRWCFQTRKGFRWYCNYIE